MDEAKHQGLPVPGYKPQNDDAVKIVTRFKHHEERILRELELWDTLDPRMIAIGRTKLQEAFMWINRAVFQPGRVALPEDSSPSSD